LDWLAGNGNHGKGRLWLDGVISPKRDKSLIQKLMTMVAATSQLGSIVLVVTAGGYPLGGLNLVRPWRLFGLIPNPVGYCTIKLGIEPMLA